MKENKNKNYISGRVAEAIVEQMFKQAGYVILRYGYESIAQNLIQSTNRQTTSTWLEVVESAPDFIVKDSNKFLYFLEVKYRSKFNKEELTKNLEKQSKYWGRTHVILVTPVAPFFTMLYRYNDSWVKVELKDFKGVSKIPKELLTEMETIVQYFFKK